MEPPPDSAVAAALQALARGEPLGEDAVAAAFGAVMAGRASEAQIAGLLLGLRARGETPEELAGVVRALRGAMRRVDLRHPSPLVDTCGTGGGTVRTVNISTAASFVAAGAGVPIAKHGNRSFTSRSGSADLLESLGVAINLPAEQIPAVFDQAGIVFLFAPDFHPAMKHASGVRRQLGVATVMNLVGPLANPASVERQVVGVSEARHGPLVAGALQRLGANHVLVVHAAAGLDEIAPVGTTTVWEVRDGAVREWQVDPGRYGLATPDLRGTEGGEPGENAAVVTALFDDPGGAAPALRASVILNAAAAILVSGAVADLGAGVDAATASLDGGHAAARLDALRRAAPLRTS